jgi:hypothetical protein
MKHQAIIKPGFYFADKIVAVKWSFIVELYHHVTRIGHNQHVVTAILFIDAFAIFFNSRLLVF